ncbi:MAG TPA: protein disulfide oxidoreductase [Salmonella bongori]|uniref:Secreted protein, suppressor for copper-sensitivity D n=3 Tax=Salmonella bongori TaxID=54736 RepID=A0A0K0H9I6_SALBC|nr:protein disulfide oxidoreductase [Salmonella bongori]ASG55164.1 protein disulfide oxidoreductase [Salmonella bongori serovar 66:z41:- str. SA19983605]ECC9753870.1 protein disulfide oxidoreductase [Salmonella bongori]EDP8564410.1 protein disulfide oxidoreductase [Salmonella bongori]EDP8608204.1 protein disulfide oxidoreductase [Salmonella bongori]EDP8650543.1 protein disulfide oxidoreductase [Salmonella bongori]
MAGKRRRWLREAVILLAILVVVMASVDVWRAPQAPPAFATMPLRTLAGEPITLATLSEERPVLLYFWASWCGVCRFTTPAVNRLAAEGENVMTIALRSGDDTEIARWLARKGISFPVVNDASGDISARWEISVTPTLVVVSQGRVVFTTSGWTSYWGMKLRLWWAKTF